MSRTLNTPVSVNSTVTKRGGDELGGNIYTVYRILSVVVVETSTPEFPVHPRTPKGDLPPFKDKGYTININRNTKWSFLHLTRGSVILGL